MFSNGNAASHGDVVQEVSNRLHVDIVPGTEVLADFEGAHFVHGGKENVVLVPQPHDDLHDPLNWSPAWKRTILANTAAYMFLGNFTSLSISPMTPVLMAEFNVNITKVALLTGVCILALGYANFAIIPCANVLGRRPTALACSLICIAANIWEALAQSYKSMLGGRALIGIGAATSESLMPLVIADLVFLHERGRWMGVYFWAFFTGAWLGPVIAGTLAEYATWRWFFWLTTIMQCTSFVMLVLFFPETKYHRDNALLDLARATDIIEPSPTGAVKTEIGHFNEFQEVQLPSASPATATAIEQAQPRVSPFFGKGSPSNNQRWNVWFEIDKIGLQRLPRDVAVPFYIATFPIVIFAACCTAFPACALLVLNLLESPAFSGPPFDFAPSSVGYTNFALMGGGIFGLFTAGPLSDWTSMVLTKRNRGVREPEMRLLSLLPFVLIGLIGMTVSALGFQHKWPWEVIVIVGFGFSGTMVMAIPTIGITVTFGADTSDPQYAVDSYKPVAGEIMVVATVLKNTFAVGPGAPSPLAPNV
ncbi:hypothetical protein H2204_013352 [Knufia peltigerae]|uniref:Major facilitator superfamily (MFS) profile domain-containing protein n=1 Tax=Knufia peltigerae TaxID=1002370 RepID=A0AA39CRF8_9EURO|nr:hypothetical protein H2204_013352 [Knufia peltigerae]